MRLKYASITQIENVDTLQEDKYLTNKEGAQTKQCKTKEGKEIHRRLWKVGNTGFRESDDRGE